MSTKLVRIENLKTSKVWIPLYATNFNWLMYPNFFISLILGHFPYKFESSSYVFSRSRFIYSTLIILGYVALLVNILYQLNYSNLITDDIATVIHMNFFFFLDGWIIVVMFVLCRDKLRVLQNLFETSEILSPQDFNDLAKLIHAKDILGSLFLVAHVPRFFIGDRHLIIHLVMFYILIVNFLMDMFYMNCVCILNACFKKVNENLSQLMKTLLENECQSEIQTEKLSLEGQRSPFLLIRLKHLEEKHLQISDSVQLLNKTFLVRVIVVAISTFTVVTFNFYFYLLWLGGKQVNSVLGPLWVHPYIISAIYHLCKFAVVAFACESATNQTLKIGTTLHDLLSIASDASVKRELRMFSLQVLHRDNKFSAKVFTINAALLTQILGGIMMYILILFQFLLNSIACGFSK